MDETLNAPVEVTEAETINSNETVIIDEAPVEITEPVTVGYMQADVETPTEPTDDGMHLIRDTDGDNIGLAETTE